MIDNASLLIGIAFSGAALVLALVIGWLNSRAETYLIHGATGIGLIVLAMVALGLRGDSYTLLTQLIPFPVMLAGLAYVYSGSRLFNYKPVRPALWIGSAAIILTFIPLALGLTGVGTLMLNLNAGVILALCGLECWRGRADVRLAMVANAIIYGLVAASFLACAIMLLVEGQWILDGPPDNLAEDINSIMSLVGLTGIGAITLTLHHARAARRHRMEANTDALTGVLNRRALFQAFSDNTPTTGLAVIMFDLDCFKQINDHLGHAHGDMVLVRFADVLRSELRHSDIIARIGGEEFCAILPGGDRDMAGHAAERVRRAFDDLALPGGSETETATVSAGLAAAGEGETFSSVLSRADTALYGAKEAGRNRVHIAPFRLVA
ncbi:diguanylate cyclase (GGDEF)-like protein [Devosia subaequoris]|uniref:diguanylate cyclase n=1 Tax=Devosia subaequoris TaxID=395930 RepID=A0A7W6ILE5_9HYPH|nr:GGDEF domain-containing protein [Devosia subaequoris]MBB4051768.1 diguanylate cyclase (GGDEF)-like protein [Devosia subaequoris]MCP1210927.1 GGDEF domain-containing protein [Devosia subaequoris]